MSTDHPASAFPQPPGDILPRSVRRAVVRAEDHIDPALVVDLITRHPELAVLRDRVAAAIYLELDGCGPDRGWRAGKVQAAAIAVMQLVADAVDEHSERYGRHLADRPADQVASAIAADLRDEITLPDDHDDYDEHWQHYQQRDGDLI